MAANQTPAALPSVPEILSQRTPRKRVNEQHAESFSPMERAALWITVHVGTMGFFILIAVWTVVWLCWNLLAQMRGWTGMIFDQPWSFLIWLFISNLLQIHLMPLIMVGQNLQARHSELRADHAYDVTVQNEYETEMILRYLQTICEDLEKLSERVAALEKPAP
ncbi:MAG TPA: DUF1003 domain-containing protein [Armatimonadota bacterium]|jgi:uncharacterized membrane protein